MISDQDVEKLKGIFLTREDGKEFAQQKDLTALTEKVDHIQEELGDLKVEFREVHDKIDTLDAKIDTLDVKFDAMLDLLTGSMQEHSVGAVQFARHDRQIKALASATGVALPE